MESLEYSFWQLRTYWKYNLPYSIVIIILHFDCGINQHFIYEHWIGLSKLDIFCKKYINKPSNEFITKNWVSEDLLLTYIFLNKCFESNQLSKAVSLVVVRTTIKVTNKMSLLFIRQINKKKMRSLCLPFTHTLTHTHTLCLSLSLTNTHTRTSKW